MEKKQAQELTNDILVADALLRLKVIENLLIEKGITTQDELNTSVSLLTDTFTKHLLQKANVPGNLDDIIKNLKEKH